MSTRPAPSLPRADRPVPRLRDRERALSEEAADPVDPDEPDGPERPEADAPADAAEADGAEDDAALGPASPQVLQ